MGKTSSMARRRGVRFSAVALGIGLLIASGAARAQDSNNDDDDMTFEERIIDSIMKGIGATNMENSGIDYRERSPLVVPPKLDLPPPVSARAEVNVPNWPKDPDEARRKAAIARRKKDAKDTRDATQKAYQAALPLSPAQLDAARTAAPSGGTHDSGTEQPGGYPDANPLSPSQLGFSGKLSDLFGGNKTETAQFKGEPPRESLTEPPPGYQTPSPNFAYGTGKELQPMYKPYNPSAGQYGNDND